eukprot:GHVU01220127.1.p3 GENE.GHVU01220127.1~~GHVU01220127.1.p3  ORF type:complete len:118 (-),score=36.33 GHVU01220127.1:186-539(-)
MLGNGRLDAYCFDGHKRLCHIRGKMRKKCWVSTGDIILVTLRDFQMGKADVIYKYMPDEARQLRNAGELPESAQINENEDDKDADDVFFAESDGSDVASSSEDEDEGDDKKKTVANK